VITVLRKRKKHEPLLALSTEKELPFVTIQLPIYNEMYVVERLIESVAAFDYPKDRFEIQVLDDSTDETVGIIAKKVKELQEKGILIEHVRRPSRVGFKAGALKYGLTFAKGEFVAIFDADFLPRPDFLRKVLPYFTSEEVGLVQTRWEHLNQGYSILTEVQAFHLDAHFSVEQCGRYVGGYFMSFNGTGGIWRKDCIQDAGGWEADTLTEDLDLSYRAQLKGWKLRYIDAVSAPAELPVVMGAIKSQQYRWMKGGAEVARKALTRVWQKEGLDLGTRVHATYHLLGSAIFIMVLGCSALSVPFLYLKNLLPAIFAPFLALSSIFLISFVILGIFYYTSVSIREKTTGASIWRLTKGLLPFLSFSMGLALHNSIAVIQGFIGKRTPFIRTPKFNVQEKSDSWKINKYLSRKIKPSVYAELLLACYFIGGIGLGIYYQDFDLLPFHIMLAFGYGAIGYFGVLHALRRG